MAGAIAGICAIAAPTSLTYAGVTPATANLSGLTTLIEPASINLSELMTLNWQTSVPSEAASSSAADPLAAFTVPAMAEVADPRGAILAGMPEVPVPERGEDNSIAEASVAFEERRVPRWIVDAIMRAADATGADPVYMMALADKESSFIPRNKAATSSAEGLFQFISSTWLEVLRSFGAKHGYGAEASAIKLLDGQLSVPDDKMREHILGLRRNPYVSALMAGELKIRDTARIEVKLGRKISRSEFYLSHFLGVDRAEKFMNLVGNKPKQSAPRWFPAAAKANKTLFFTKVGRKTRQLTLAEVYEKIDAMIDSRLDRYENVLDVAVADATL